MSNARHGLSNTKLYHVWDTMNQRCSNPNSTKYSEYGGRGIVVCDDWKEPYLFMGWALLNGYKETLTIERVDPDKGYCPDNCTWIPAADQALNKRMSSKNTSGYSGVSFHKGTGKWAARVTVNSVRKQLGRFITPEEANTVRKQYFIDNNLQEHLRVYELQHKNK